MSPHHHRRPSSTCNQKQSLPARYTNCEDYGFERAFTVEKRSQLLDLYIGLMDPGNIGISPKTINDRRVRGVLVEEIKAAYHKIPAEFGGEYFPWFPQNQHILNPGADSQSNEKGDAAMVMQAWCFTEGSETDSPADIRVHINSMDQGIQFDLFGHTCISANDGLQRMHAILLPWGHSANVITVPRSLLLNFWSTIAVFELQARLC